MKIAHQGVVLALHAHRMHTVCVFKVILLGMTELLLGWYDCLQGVHSSHYALLFLLLPD